MRGSMAFKLTPEEIRTKQELIASLTDVNNEIAVKIDIYNNILNTAENFCIDVVGRFESEFDGKSVEWRSTDEGERVIALIRQWQSVNLDSIQRSEDHAEILEDLADE